MPLAKCAARHTGRKTTASPEQGKIRLIFHFGTSGERVQTEDPFQSIQRYRYDAESRLLEYARQFRTMARKHLPMTMQVTFSALSDIDWKTLHAGKSDAFRTNRLPFCRHTGFNYDSFGNLAYKTQDSLTQHFAYDDENRLLKA